MLNLICPDCDTLTTALLCPHCLQHGVKVLTWRLDDEQEQGRANRKAEWAVDATKE